MKVALVTGGTRGIGLAMVKALQAINYKVAVVAKTFKGSDCDLYIQTDLSFIHGRYGIIQKVVDEFGRLDLLVNNAGAQTHAAFTKYELTQFNKDFSLMVAAPFDLSQQAAHHMFAHGGGHIVNVLSTAAFQGARNICGYITAKHALLGLTRAMAVELAPTIHVNAIVPGFVETDMTKGIEKGRRKLLESITPSGRFCKPEEIADALLYLANSTAVYGQAIIVDGGWLVKNG